MALPEIEYILDPESEPELDVDEIYDEEPIEQLQGCIVNDRTFAPEPTEDPMREPKTEAPAESYEESDVSEEEEEDEKRHDKDSDKEWAPLSSAEEVDEDMKKSFSEEDSDAEKDAEKELSDTKKTSKEPKIRQLCTDCGSFHYRKNHTCEHKTKLYVCNICGKRCVSESSLKLHNIIHSETYEHYCKYCYSACKTKTDKFNHEQTHLKERKPYKCPKCEGTFASLKDRRTHMKSHEKPNKFTCDICGLTIGRKHKPRHMQMHTGAKPHKCSICERTFTQASHLKSHMRLHTGERPYKCQSCDKAFNHNVSLKSHVQRYHPLESGEGLDKINDGVAEIHDETGGDSGDNEQQQETKQTQKPKGTKYVPTGRPPGRPKKNTSQKPKGTKYLRTGRPRGRPKKTTSLITDYSFDSNEGGQGFLDLNDLIDFHQEQILKNERNMKRKLKHTSRSSSDSDYDPDEETHSDFSGKKSRPRKV